MTPNELVDKFKIDRFSLSNIEMDELFELISKDSVLVRDIKDNWLMDEYISRVIATDRQMFPSQVLKRISELDSNQKKVLTMDQIVNASKDIKLSSSGRYRHKSSERKPSAISSRGSSATSSKRTSAVSGRRNFSRRSGSSPFVLLIAALLILGIGAFFLFKKGSPSNITTDSPVKFTQNLALDLPKIVAGEKTIVMNGEPIKALNYIGLSLKEGSELKVEKGGSLDLEYSDHSRVVVHEDSKIKIPSSINKKLYLESGSISCDVTKQKISFKIASNNSLIQVIGTSFDCFIHEDNANTKNNATELLVKHGKVEIENTNTKEKIIVSQGQHTFVKNDNKLELLDNKKKSIQYNFSDKILPNGLDLVENKNSLLSNGDLTIADGSVIYKLKATSWKFPLKISYQAKYTPNTKDLTIVLMSGIMWDDVSYGILSRSMPFNLQSEVWVKFENYITEDNYFYCICSANNLNRVENVSSRIAYMEKGPNSNSLLILLKGFRGGDVTFDNLEVSEIDQADLPDFLEVKKIFNSLPRTQDIKVAVIDKFPIIINNNKEYRAVNVQFGPNAIER